MRIKIYLVLLFFLPTVWSFAQQPIPKSREDHLVLDNAHLMSGAEVAQLDRKLIDYARATSVQIVVYTVLSLNGESASEFTTRLGHEWQIGDAEKDNGVIVFVSKNDRRIQIQTGYGSEIFLPDAIAKRIVDNILTPAFKKGQFYAGIDRATDAIMELASDDYKPKKKKRNFNIVPDKKEKEDGIPPIVIIVGVILLFIILSRLNNGGGGNGGDGGYNRDGRYDYPGRRRRGGGWIFFPGGGFGGGGSSGGGGFGGGGGGFGGFGGGDFGGGGAGGGW